MGLGWRLKNKEENNIPTVDEEESINGNSNEMPGESAKDNNIEMPPTFQVDVTPEDLEEGHAAHHNPEHDKKSESEDGASSLRSLQRLAGAGTFTVTAFIFMLGLAVSGAFTGLGISAAIKVQNDSFDRNAIDLVNKISSSWSDYVNAAGMIHGRCRSRSFTRADFRDLYEYLIGGGLQFQAAQFDPNITREEREYYEAEARQYYAENYPHVEYRGIIGFEYANSTSLEPRSQQDFYFPIHYMEPIVGNERAIDLDYHASGSRKRTVLHCMNKGEPALTDRLRLVQETEMASYGVVLMHPGYPLTTSSPDDRWPRDLASIVIRIPDLLRRATDNQGHPALVYIFDKSDSSGSPLFLGGVEITPSDDAEKDANLEFVDEQELEEVRGASKLYQEIDVQIANKVWTISILSMDGTFEPDYVFVIVGGIIILLASIGLAWWVHQNTNRVAKINRLKAEAEAERASLILESARKAADAERELNDFIAHEVRNPVSAALSAVSFVGAELKRKNPFQDKESLAQTREDVYIIDNALKFVNDLLRNMLDMHRAANKQLKVTLCPTDVLHDVLEPVQAMLTQRGGKIRVEVKCEDGTFAMADRLRLKQVMLNLGRNSAKFVEEGYIRLTATPYGDGHIQLAVEDSGPGIPEEKKKLLFQKYQESLDMLSQGTGIGLFLCKNLVDLMDGQIYLDDDFESGIPNCKGTRFVVELKVPPEGFLHDEHESLIHDNASRSQVSVSESHPKELPENLSVLFVDDDPILRKLFARTVRTVAPNWSIREASNGETALQIVENTHFDLIFMDMYMASVQKQLLGTETVLELRNRGVTCRICGLSANDKETEFLEAGADVFTFKPFACERGALRQELFRVLYSQPGDTEYNRE